MCPPVLVILSVAKDLGRLTPVTVILSGAKDLGRLTPVTVILSKAKDLGRLHPPAANGRHQPQANSDVPTSSP